MLRPSLPAILVVALAALAAPAAARAEGSWIGLQLADGRRGGVAIRDVVGGSPGDKAGIRGGEEVLEVDGRKIAERRELVKLVGAAPAGTHLVLKLAGPEGTRTVDVVLEPRPGAAAVQSTVLLGKSAPDFVPRVVAGRALPSLASLRGQVVLLDFFATWCGPCRAAMPHVQRLHETLGKRGLRVVGISAEDREIVAGAAARFKINYTLVADINREISDRYHVYALPTAVIVDRAGRVHAISVADAAEAERKILLLLGHAE